MVLIPYFLCGVNSAIIVTKIKCGKDIRTLGSGNAGLTNTLRTQGKAAALFVLLGDVLKGVLSVIAVDLCFRFIAGIDVRVTEGGWTWVLYAAGVAAILGHVFPIYYGFKGGKGVLVTVSVLLAINWIPAVILLLLGYMVTCLIVGGIMAKVCGMSRRESMLAATPAGASDMALISADLGVQSPDLIVLQVVRMLVVISVFPQIINLLVHFLP